ncbi:IS66 family insertion sequence element accessory protein TnpA [Hydromonas duriensis]|uniref:Uncharacterized protein n=1 Tax=Hydromonas duriensis TaxID=1527608 RepID=A0A4R6Y6T7_9BURK|nr:hypothetical protein [Hydromonas duriensis]TDR31068.1 hypothetical protein DFR44_11320 [Hydromonas duriensis]
MSKSALPSKRSHPCKGKSKADYRAYRQHHVKLWQASGLSKSDYAMPIGVSKDSVRDWVRDFARAVSANASPLNDSNLKPAKFSATFVPMRLQPVAQSNALKLTWAYAYKILMILLGYK